ncbi:MAG: PopZ family protein, partial [Notoacmeibacter sp.]
GSNIQEQGELSTSQPLQDDDVAELEAEPILELTPVAAPLLVEAVVEPAAEAVVPTLQSEMAKLVSQTPERRVAAAFDDLNSAFIKAKSLPIEGVAEAMLRPMLQDWLDNNLPNLVERLVREEISRIARGDI